MTQNQDEQRIHVIGKRKTGSFINRSYHLSYYRVNQPLIIQDISVGREVYNAISSNRTYFLRIRDFVPRKKYTKKEENLEFDLRISEEMALEAERIKYS